jgi:hypothetical protein
LEHFRLRPASGSASCSRKVVAEITLLPS